MWAELKNLGMSGSLDGLCSSWGGDGGAVQCRFRRMGNFWHSSRAKPSGAAAVRDAAPTVGITARLTEPKAHRRATGFFENSGQK